MSFSQQYLFKLVIMAKILKLLTNTTKACKCCSFPLANILIAKYFPLQYRNTTYGGRYPAMGLLCDLREVALQARAELAKEEKHMTKALGSS